MLSGNMFGLVAYCVANCCVSCFITMLCHLAFSSNVLGDLASSHYVLCDLFRLFVIWAFVTWMCVTWVF